MSENDIEMTLLSDMTLLSALESNEYSTFEQIFEKRSANDGVFDLHPDLKICLEKAVSDPTKIFIFKFLIEHKVDLNHVYNNDNSGLLHLAVENGNLEALKGLLTCDRINVDIKKTNGDTALHMAIKKIKDLDDDRKNDLTMYEDMIERLLKAGCNANSPDAGGITPIHSAAKQGLKKVVTLILDYSEEPVNLFTRKDDKNKTDRDYVKEAFPSLLPEFDIKNLFDYLMNNEVKNFNRYFTKLTKTKEHLPALHAYKKKGFQGTMLQLATERSLQLAVETLLNYGADPSAICPDNTSTPVTIACRIGNGNILKKLFYSMVKFTDGGSLLHIAIKGLRYAHEPVANFIECINIILNEENVCTDVNYPDSTNNTALYYAAKNGHNNIVLTLLRKNAYVGLRNKNKESPLDYINANTLEKYLDECIMTIDKWPNDDDYEIYVNYSFLTHPNNVHNYEPHTDNSSNNNSKYFEVILEPETNVLLYMAREEELRPLIKHPVITSFLYLKWQRIECLFYANIILYSFFLFSLILYILFGYRTELKHSDYKDALNNVTHVGASVGLILLIFRELFQLLVSPVRYLQSIVNWMEIMLIIVTTLILSYNSAEESTKQQLSATAVLFLSAELVLLVSKFPSLSTNCIMLKTVSWNFFKFLLLYGILIIAFSLSFYTLFRHQEIEEHEDQKAPNPKSTGNEDFFEDPARSLFKTIVMMTGEFESGSIKFSTFPVTSHIIFILFVFMIPIVLFNLLNGLAVSDTLKIRADAELLGHIYRIKIIYYIETQVTAFSNPSKIRSYFPERWMEVLLAFWSRCWFMDPMYYIKRIARRIILLPCFLPKRQIIVYPNQFNKIKIPHPFGTFENVEYGGCCFKKGTTYRLDKKIVQHAKVIIAGKRNVYGITEY